LPDIGQFGVLDAAGDRHRAFSGGTGLIGRCASAGLRHLLGSRATEPRPDFDVSEGDQMRAGMNGLRDRVP
jgi:hypothetical protein